MVAVKFWFQTATSTLACLLGVAVLAGSAASDPSSPSASADLQHRLQQLDGVIAAFDQQITNNQGYLIEEAQGTLYLAKPRFRWDVREPFPQIIIADDDLIQIYDPDLEQVTQRQIEGSLDQAPLALLTRSSLALEAHFTVAFIVNEPGFTRFMLTPVSADALFSRMEMVFHGEMLSAMSIFDHTGQQTLIRFADYLTQQVIQSSVFELEFPPGTDFVRG